MLLDSPELYAVRSMAHVILPLKFAQAQATLVQQTLLRQPQQCVAPTTVVDVTSPKTAQVRRQIVLPMPVGAQASCAAPPPIYVTSRKHAVQRQLCVQ